MPYCTEAMQISFTVRAEKMITMVAPSCSATKASGLYRSRYTSAELALMSLTYQTTVNSKNLSAGMLSAKGMRRNSAVSIRKNSTRRSNAMALTHMVKAPSL